MYEEFTNLFDDLEKKIEDGNIIIEGDVNINIVETDDKKGQTIGKKAIKSIRGSKNQNKFKKRIRKRDEEECQCCHDHVPNGLQVHHILPISKYPDLANDDHNGIGLCEKCHSKYHQMYQGAEGADTFAKFLRDYGNRRFENGMGL